MLGVGVVWCSSTLLACVAANQLALLKLLTFAGRVDSFKYNRYNTSSINPQHQFQSISYDPIFDTTCSYFPPTVASLHYHLAG